MQKFHSGAPGNLSDFWTRCKINKMKTMWFDRAIDALSNNIKIRNI